MLQKDKKKTKNTGGWNQRAPTSEKNVESEVSLLKSLDKHLLNVSATAKRVDVCVCVWQGDRENKEC